MQLAVLIMSFAGIVVVTQLIYTTLSREITLFSILPGPDKSRYHTPHRGISNNQTATA